MATGKAKRKARRQAERSPAVAEPSPSASSRPEPSGGRFRVLLLAVALAYLATVWLDGIGSNLPAKLTPRPWLYFSQIAALFKSAGMMAIDYRAEGWSCSERKWVEVDVRPFFRIDADNKENRFHRALQFYRRERKVMRALEEYVVRSHNAVPGRPTIGGVRFLSLRIPYPKLGEHVDRVERKPLDAYPEEQRHAWYWTPGSKRRERCGDKGGPPRSKSDDAPVSKEDESSSPDTGATREKEPEP